MLKKIEHGEVLELHIGRPPVNALDPTLVHALHEAITSAPAAGARALVLSGTPGMFSAGLDVAALLKLDHAGMGKFWEEFFSMLRSLAVSPIPVACAITGHSPAGGAVMSIFCDYRIAAQGKFKIGLNEVQVGLPVPRVILAGLKRIVGERQAERLAVRGLLISPDECLACGLVDQVLPSEEVVPAAVAWCHSLLKLPSKAMHTTRGVLREDYPRIFDELLSRTRDEMTAVWFSEESQRVLKGLMAELQAKKK